MKIIIDSKTSLHDFATRVAKHTNMPVTRLKTAIAKGFAFSHIAAFESALEANKAPITATEPQTIATPSEQSLPDGIVAKLIILRDWLQDNADGNSDICFDDDGKVTSKVLLPELERLIAGDYRQGRSPDASGLDDLKWWLRDNVDADSSIIFDNDEEGTDSETLLEALEFALSFIRKDNDLFRPDGYKASLAHSCNPSISIEPASESDVLVWAGVDSVDDLDHDLYAKSEDAVMSAAKNIISDPNIHVLAMMLEGAGMSDMLDKIKSLAYSIQINDGISELV